MERVVLGVLSAAIQPGPDTGIVPITVVPAAFSTVMAGRPAALPGVTKTAPLGL